MGMKRTGFRILLAVLATIIMISVAIAACAETAKNPLAIDMVIVIENSLRMNAANSRDRKLDNQGLRFDAAAALIGMCDAKYSRANYFLFNNDLWVYSETATDNVMKVSPNDIALFDISLPVHKPQRQSMMETLNGDRIRNGHGTRAGADIGKAFSAAVEVQMRELNNGNRKVILLLTSGNNNLSNASLQQARDAKTIADENNIEVYAVALTDTSSTQLLQELVSKPENYQFANSPEDLVDVYRNFFASMIGSNPMESRSVKVDDEHSQILLEIPNNSVAEVNIILPLQQVEDLVLTDPSGKTITRTEDNILVSKSRNFISYKLVSPESSTYRLSYSSAEEHNIVVQYVFSYGVQVQAAANAQKVNKHEPVTITANYMMDGLPSTDSKLYKIPATLTLRKGNQVISSTTMETDNNSYFLTFSDLEKYGAGVYTADIHFEGDGLKRDSETVTFELVNNPPELISSTAQGDKYEVTINIPKEKDSYEPEKNRKEWDLNTFVKDINGDSMTAAIVSNTTEADATVDGMKLLVTPKQDTATEGDIRVAVRDDDGGEGPELLFHIAVQNYESRYDTYTLRFDAVKPIQKKTTCELALRIYDANGREVKDDSQVPEEITAQVSESEVDRIQVKMTREGDCWKGSFPTGDHAAEYSAAAEVSIGQKIMKTQEFSVSTYNDAPVLKSASVGGDSYSVVINIPREADSYVPEKNRKSWDLNDFVKDLNEDELTSTIVSNSTEADASVDGLILTVVPRKDTATDGTVQVVVTDNDQAGSPQLSFRIHVDNFESRYDTYTARFDPVKHIEKNSSCDVALRMYDAAGNEIRQDDQVPDEIIASVAETGSQPEDLRLIRDGNVWKGTFQTGGQATDYTLGATIQVGQKTIVAEKMVISSENKAPSLKTGAKDRQSWNFTINEPSDKESYKVQQKSWNLEDIVEDLNGDKITFAVDEKETTAKVNASVNPADQTLTVNTILNTETDGDVVVTCQDNDGVAGPKLSFHITVTSNEEKYKLYKAELSTDGHGKSRDTVVTLAVYDEKGLLVTRDSNMPDEMEANYTLENVQEPLPMKRSEDGKWTGTFKTVDTEAEYVISAAVKISDVVSIAAPDLILRTSNTAPRVTRELNAAGIIPDTINIEPFLLWSNATGDIVIEDLNQYFADADGDQLKFSADTSNASEKVEATVSGSKLTIRGLAETSESVQFTVSATDNEKQTATGKPVTVTVKSLKKQGIITLAIIAAAIIVLLIIIQLIKPKYPSGAFEVSVNSVPFNAGSQLPKGGMAKKSVALQAYAPTMAKSEYGPEIHTALAKVMLKPGFSKTVKVDATKANGINVRINGKDQRKGKLANNGKLMISKNDTNVVFELKLTGLATGPKKTGNPNAAGSARSTGRTSAADQNKSRMGSRT